MLKLKRQVSSLVVVLVSKIKYNKTQINMPTTEQPAKSPIGLHRLISIFSADFSVINILAVSELIGLCRRANWCQPSLCSLSYW